MARIVGIGIAALDIINTTDGYPQEDDEVRALAQDIRRGGNVTNTLTVLTQLGHQCEWLGTLGDDANSSLIQQELLQHQIELHHCRIVPGGHAPTSYITLNRQNGSRTIVHYRNLPELSFDDFSKDSLEGTDWLHFEGRNIDEMVKILDWIKLHYPTMCISIEIEKPRENIELLYKYGDLLLFSRQFALSAHYQDGASFLRSARNQCVAPVLVCPWSLQGAYAVDKQGKLYHANAVQIPQVLDTIGAGDTFNAGFIHAMLTGFSLMDCLRYANTLAGKKCGQYGFDNLTQGLTPNHD